MTRILALPIVDGGDVVPGWWMSVADLFASLD